MTITDKTGAKPVIDKEGNPIDVGLTSLNGARITAITAPHYDEAWMQTLRLIEVLYEDGPATYTASWDEGHRVWVCDQLVMPG
jgi:hypothetical protein